MRNEFKNSPSPAVTGARAKNNMQTKYSLMLSLIKRLIVLLGSLGLITPAMALRMINSFGLRGV
tara:strand:+ start:381 stop:572 length:192 start_codon:yes stop_codon:yes gene_type:complete